MYIVCMLSPTFSSPLSRFTPSGGGRARRGRGLKEMSKGGRGSKSGSRAQSEEVGSQSSGSDHSDTEGSSEMVRTAFRCNMWRTCF